MADRRAEIARKKAQIEQLRKERMEKERAKKGEHQVKILLTSVIFKSRPRNWRSLQRWSNWLCIKAEV